MNITEERGRNMKLEEMHKRIFGRNRRRKRNKCKEENYKRIEVECVDRPEQTISYEPDYKYYEK